MTRVVVLKAPRVRVVATAVRVTPTVYQPREALQPVVVWRKVEVPRA